MTVLNPSRHLRDRRHHLAPTVELTLPNTRCVRVGRTLCGLPAGVARTAAELCPECREIAEDLGAIVPALHFGTQELREAERVPCAWALWRAEIAGPGLLSREALDAWPREAALFREVVASRDMGPLVVPGPASIVLASKSRLKLFESLRDWGVITLEPLLLGRQHAWRVVARHPAVAKIAPRDPCLEPWPGDVMTKGTRTRLVLGRPVDGASNDAPRMVCFRDGRGSRKTIRWASWRRWSASALATATASRRVADLADAEAA